MILIKNGLVRTMTDSNILKGEILVDKGKIAEIGRNLKFPEGTQVVDARAGLVLPGFIDSHCHIGIFEWGTRYEGDDGNEISDPVTPELRAIDGINFRDSAFTKALESGVTTVATGPGSANAIGGQFAALKTSAPTLEGMILKEPLAMKVAFGENPKTVYGREGKKPVTRMANAALIREWLGKAAEYSRKLEKAEKDDGEAPSLDMKLQALVPVIRREIPLKAHSHRVDDMLTALRIAREYNVDITLDHCTEGHLAPNELAKAQVGMILGPIGQFSQKPETRNMTLSTPADLVKAGAKVAIMTDLPAISLDLLPYAVGLCMRGGLSEEDAFKGITRNAAEILNIADRVGTLECGKDADIIIYQGHPFLELDSRCMMTMVDGRIVYRRSGGKDQDERQ